MKKICIMCIMLLCVLTISGCNNKYADKMRLAEDYLNDELSIDCTVVDCDFRQYSYGITGGMFMYTINCRSGDGSEFKARYQSYADLTPETVSRIKPENRA